MSKCGDQIAFDSDVSERLGATNYYCPNLTNSTLSGAYSSEVYQYLEIRFLKCTKATKCKSLSEIESAMAGGTVDFIFTNQNFDFGNMS